MVIHRFTSRTEAKQSIFPPPDHKMLTPSPPPPAISSHLRRLSSGVKGGRSSYLLLVTLPPSLLPPPQPTFILNLPIEKSSSHLAIHRLKFCIRALVCEDSIRGED